MKREAKDISSTKEQTMDQIEANNTIGLHVIGDFDFLGNPDSSFHGPIKRGLKLLLWGNFYRKATSCVFIIDGPIIVGESRQVEVLIYSATSIDKLLCPGEYYFIGTPGKSLGKLKITKFIGKWEGKIPS